MSNLKDNAGRFGPEPTIGGAITDGLQSLIATTFKPSGGSGPKRTASGGVNPTQQVRDNVAEYAPASLALTTPSVYSAHAPFRAAVCGSPSSYSGGAIVTYDAGFSTTASDITAVASGNKLAKGAGTWAAFPALSVVKVTGFGGGAGKNPASFVALVQTAPGSGANLQFLWPTLVDETPPGSVTVSYVRQLRMGSTLQTFLFEIFNAVNGYGTSYSTVGVKDWTHTVDIKTAECTEVFNFVCGASPVPITAALGNATIPFPAVFVHNSNVHFGYKVAPSFGGMFRYNGTMFSPGSGSGQLRINKIEHKVTRNVADSGGIGNFGPLSLYTDGFLEVMLTLEVMRDSAQAEQMLQDRENKDFVASIGFALIDGSGQKLYRYYPALQYDTGDATLGIAQQGEDYVTFPMKARLDTTMNSMFQETLLGV